MATLPVRRGGRNTSLVNPTREFKDIYDRIGQLINFAFGDLARVEMPWVPLADLSETDDAYVVKVELPGSARTRSTCSCRTGNWSSAARSRRSRTVRTEAATGTAARAAPAGSSSAPACPATSTPTRFKLVRRGAHADHPEGRGRQAAQDRDHRLTRRLPRAARRAAQRAGGMRPRTDRSLTGDSKWQLQSVSISALPTP